MEERWVSRYLGEVIGTFVLVLFGCVAVVIAVVIGQASDLFSAGLAWGFAVALAMTAPSMRRAVTTRQRGGEQ